MPQIPELAGRAAVMWEAFVEALDGRLAGRDWIALDTYSFADITALITIDFARSAKLGMPDEARHLRRWHAAASARPSAAV